MMNPDDAQAQALWDAKCAAAPRCDCCGKSVYPHDIYIETDDDVVYCQKCFHIVHTEDLEL